MTVTVDFLEQGLRHIFDITQQCTALSVKQQAADTYGISMDTFDLTLGGSLIPENQLLMGMLTSASSDEIQITPNKMSCAMVYLKQLGKETSFKGLKNEIINNGSEIETYLNAQICTSPEELGSLLKTAIRSSSSPAKVIQLLLQHGAPVATDHGSGRTIIMLLCEPKYYNMFSEDTILDILTVILNHCGKNHPVINQRDTDGSTALMYASSSEMDANRVFVHELLQAGALVNVSNSKGRTPLSYSCSNESEGGEMIARTLLNHGAVTSQTIDGKTDLMYASSNEAHQASLVQMIMDHTDFSVVANRHSHRFRTPLMYGCANEGQYALDIVTTLLSNDHIKASIDSKNSNGRTALLYAVTNPGECGKTIVELLIQRVTG
eukprot:TRINITY_DN4279_c1_g1_i1.p1 TRINITY_DN4279_c1_g1~~TRINITY_DN4279_c1_g1_i1.p1  ORF type:complete len:379 (+),score=56.88 TRINITY_DN4279_c1_g1_i1:142-1278(+)